MASNENGTPPAAPKSKKTAVEEIYQKKSQLEHILLRPDTYIGKICNNVYILLAMIRMIIDTSRPYIVLKYGDNCINDWYMDKGSYSCDS